MQLVELLGLRPCDFGQQDLVCRVVAKMIRNKTGLTSGVRLARLWPDLLARDEIIPLLSLLVTRGSAVLALEWAGELGTDVQVRRPWGWRTTAPCVHGAHAWGHGDVMVEPCVV